MAHKLPPAPTPTASDQRNGRADFWLNRAAHAALDAEAARPPAGPARVSVRRQTAFAATLNHGLSYSVTHRVRDLSPGGAFVEMAAPDFPVGAAVEFVLRCHYLETPVDLRIAASVVRVDRDGVALHFGDYDDDTYTNLVKLLYTA
jgi:hypothetical protein